MVADLFGSGSQDLVTGFSRGPAATALRWQSGKLAATPTTLLSGCRPMFADVNGDGLVDHLDFGSIPGVVRVAINTGNGFLQPVDWPVAAPFSNSPAINNPGGCTAAIDGGARVVDFNGDGREDILLMGGYLTGGTHTLAILESTGSGFLPRTLAIQVPAQAPTPSGWRTAQTLDVDGNGLVDFISVIGGRLVLHTREGTKGDMVSEVVDGLGRFDRFRYEPLSERAATTLVTDCAYPRLCVKRGMWIVSRHSTDTGTVPAERAFTYQYQDARVDLSGRGWLGFARQFIVDEGTQASVEKHFDNVTRNGSFYPCAGFPILQVADIPVTGTAPAERHRRVTTARTCETVISGSKGHQYFFAYPSLTRVTEAEGVLPARRGSQTLSGFRQVDIREARDAYGNLVESEELTYPMTANGALGRADVLSTSTRFDNHDASWLIGLAARTEVTSATRSGRRISRVTEAEFDPVTGLQWKSRIGADVTAGGAPLPDPALEIVINRNEFGMVTRIERRSADATRVEKFEYDRADHSFVVARSNAQGHRVSQTYHPGLGVLATVTDMNGVVTRFKYDGFGRVREVDGPNSADGSTGYDIAPSNNFRLTTRTRGGNTVRILYDRLGREIQRDWVDSGGHPVGMQTEYDALGRMSARARPHDSLTSPVWERTTYDAINRPLSVVHPDGTQTRREYIGLGVSLWDEKNNKRSLLMDAYGRTTESVAINANGHAIRTAYSYGPYDLMEETVDAYGNLSRQVHDRLGRRSKLIESNSGTTTTRHSAFSEAIEDTFGNGGYARFERDALGRVKRLNTVEGNTDFVWDSAVNGVGRIASATSPDGVVTTLTYDALGRPVSGTWAYAGEQYIVNWEYDRYGRLALIRYPQVPGHAGRFAVRYHYSPLGRLDKVTDEAGTVTFWQVRARDAQERITEERLGNGVVTARKYASNDRIWKIESVLPGRPKIQALEYRYEANGNLFRRYDHLTGSMEEFAYDPLDRLIGWDIYQPGVRVASRYQYDDVGNLLSRQLPLGPSPSTTYHYAEGGAGVHALTSAETGTNSSSFRYDGSGNQIGSPRGSLAFNALNLPKALTASGAASDVKFRYDAFGSRIEKSSVSGERSLSIGGLYERRSSSNGSVNLFSVRVGSKVIGQVVWGMPGTPEHTYYLHFDSLGSTETVSDEEGNVLDYMKYDPFGARINRLNLGQQAGSLSTPVQIGFTGHRHDDELGLIDMRGRMYDPHLARFISPDPVVSPLFDGQAHNRYSYVRNNPLNLVDPSGLQAVSTVTFSDAEAMVITGGTAVKFSDTEGTTITAQVSTPSRNIVFTDAESAMAGGHITGNVGGTGVTKVSDDQGTRDISVRTSQPSAAPVTPSGGHPLKQQAAERYEANYISQKQRGIEPPTFVVPGSTWRAAIDATVDWIFEWGTGTNQFDANYPQVSDMKDAPKVNEARAYFIAKNREHIAKAEPSEAVTNYAGTFGLGGLIKAGTDPTEQFVGGYRIDIAPNNDGTVTFTLTNTTSMKSFLYGLGPAYPRGGVGIGGNQTQTYTWTELLIRDF